MKQLKNMIEDVKSKVLLSIARAIVKTVDDSKKMQRMQVALFKDELRDSVERFQNYGFTSNPFPGAEAVSIFPGGDRAHGLIIAVDDRRYRLTGLTKGEVAIYTDEGDKIHLKRGRNILVKCGAKVTVDCPETEFTGNITVDGNTTIKGTTHSQGNITSDDQISDVDGSMGEMRGIYNGHHHPETGTTTSVPNEPMT